MLIAVCDTDIDFSTKFAKQIQSLASSPKTKIQVRIFVNGKAMVSALKQQEKYNAVFLEIGENTPEHFELAKLLRNTYKHLAIIFVSTDDAYALEGYSIPIFRYILKNEDDVRLRECVYSMLKEHYSTLTLINLKKYGIGRDIQADSVEYITTYKKHAIIRFWQDQSRTLELIATLEQLESEFKPYRFIRIQKGFLVNIQHIVKLSNYKVQMRSGVTVNTSRAKYKAIKTEFQRYHSNM